MAEHALYVVDVFAEEKYAGNQLAVVADGGDLPADVMQRIALETNYSETTFVLARRPRDGGFDVRYFTPAAEIPFAGHPTLGTAHVIRNELRLAGGDRVALNLPIGKVPVTFDRAAAGDEIVWMQPPPPTLGEIRPAELGAELLGLSPSDVDRRFPVQEVAVGIDFLLVPLRTRAALDRCRMNLEARQRRLAEGVAAGILFAICPEAEEPENQMSVRVFFDANGPREDPATGSANTCLGAYLVRHRYLGGDSVDIRVEQGRHIGRPSLLRVRAELDGDTPRVSVGGRVFTSVRGVLV